MCATPPPSPSALAGLDVDVLVNNAGIIGDLQPAQQSSAAVADALIDINLRAAVHATMCVLPGMVSRNHGHIVFTGSIAGSRPTANSAIYSATKAALAAFADGLRIDLHGAAIRVTVLAPGRVETNLYDEALGGHDAAVARLYSGATSVQPADIAALVGDGPQHAGARGCDPSRGRADDAGLRWQHHRRDRLVFRIVGSSVMWNRPGDMA